MFNASVLKMSKGNRNAILAIIFLLAFLIRIPFFSVPPERDEGAYATVAQIVLDGGIPYKDVVNFRAPGIYYIYALFFKVFGEKVEAIRIGSAVFAVLTTLIVFLLASRIYGHATGLVAAFLYAMFSSGPLIQGSLANCEAFMMLPAVSAIYTFYLGYKGKDNRFIFVSGILLGLAFLIKESSLPYLLLFVSFIPLMSWSGSTFSVLKIIAKRYSILSAGFALPILTFYLYLYLNNALYDYLIGVYNWNKGYGTYQFDLFWNRLIDRGIRSLGKEYSFLWLLSAVSLFVILAKERTMDNAYISSCVAFSFIGVCLGSMFWPHYFIQMIPFLSIAAAHGLNKTYYGVSHPKFLLKTLSLIVSLILFISIGYAVKNDYKFYFVYSPDEISKEIYGDIFVTTRDIAKYVSEQTEPSDYIYQNRWDPEIYFLSHRKSPTRYIDHPSITASPDVIKAMTELRNDILQKEPKYIIWFHPRDGEIPAYVVGPIVQFNYELETEINGVKIFRLKGWRGKNKNNV